MGQRLIEIKNIKKSYGSNVVVENLSLNIMDGEFLTLLGPSGCGKTTLLRMIAGFERPDAGEINLEGEDLIEIAPNKRQINTVFQSYALFPHLTVRDNIAYGMRMKKLPKSEIKERVDEMLELTKLESLANRKPSQMSGGQQQRVAIARSLVNRPKVVLLDEPLGALDLQLRKQMQIELKRLQRQLGTTYVYVTHDQEEAMNMSDRIVVMQAGVIEQIGTAEEIYGSPTNEFVAQFLGESNLLTGNYEENGTGALFRYGSVALEVPKQAKRPKVISIRPEQICFGQGDGALVGTITECVFMGQIFRISIELPTGQILHAFSREEKEVGTTTDVTWDMKKVSFI